MAAEEFLHAVHRRGGRYFTGDDEDVTFTGDEEDVLLTGAEEDLHVHFPSSVIQIRWASGHGCRLQRVLQGPKRIGRA